MDEYKFSLVDNRQAALIDRLTSERFGISPLELMERAAEAAASRIVELYRNEGTQAWHPFARHNTRHLSGNGMQEAGYLGDVVLVLAGPGNNGGDALGVAARLHRKGIPVRIASIEPAMPSESAVVSGAGNSKPERGPSSRSVQKEACETLGLSPADLKLGIDRALLSSVRLVVDGLFGIGFSGNLRPEAAAIVAELNRLLTGTLIPMVALDLPSGLTDEWEAGMAVLAADLTLCFGFAKRCLYMPGRRSLAGIVEVLDIGFPKAAFDEALNLKDDRNAGTIPRMLDPTMIRWPAPHPETHKYDRGRVRIYAGSLGYAGAAYLSARAASLSMAGYVRLCVDDELYPILAQGAGGVVVTPASVDSSVVNEKEIVLVGPGWGRGPERMEHFKKLYGSSCPLVVDADALFLLAAWRPERRGAPLLLTPHAGELQRFAGSHDFGTDPAKAASEVARRYGALVVAKGPVTWLAAPDGTLVVWDRPNPALAVAGSGDILAGIVAAQWALGTAMDAASIAVTALSAVAERGDWPDALMLLDRIPGFFAQASAGRTFFTMYT